MKMELQDYLKRSSLGRFAFIGELYDVRSENLSSLSLLNTGFPHNLIEQSGLGQMEFHYKFTENISDRFELVDVEAELQLSILCGLIKVEGSGKFLNEEKKSEKTLSCSLVCQIKTVNEKFFASLDEFLKHVDLKMLENPKYTHMITEINWGANCLLDMVFSCNSESSKEKIRGRLAAEFSKLKVVSVEGGGQLEKTDSSFLKNENMNIKVFADLVPEDVWPSSLESFMQFVRDVPKLLNKVNGGKGKPLSYTMIPLSILRKLSNLELSIDVTVRKIDESFLMSTLYFFEDVGQMKQKLHDFNALMAENNKYVKDEDLRRVREMKEQLAINESKLKSLLSEDWVAVRSGEKTLKNLIRKIEKFKSSTFKLHTYEEYLESCAESVVKLRTISEYLSQGILYLGKGEKFQSVQIKYPTWDFIVLVTSSNIEKADSELHRLTLNYFLTLFADSPKNTKYVILDLDYTGEEMLLNCKVTVTKCFHFNGRRILSQDLYADYLQDLKMNYARLNKESRKELCAHKPGNRDVLRIPCPGFELGSCSTDALIWSCFSCRNQIEYGFDEFYYCSCGKYSAGSFEYRCGGPKHGTSFVPASNDFLAGALSKLRPVKELNLLVIGQSGVGKSTWINSIVNYLTYDSFKAAQEEGVICTIPATLTVYDHRTFEKRTVNIGNISENEVTEIGHSATQHSRSYCFFWQDLNVRIIDTPGLGDTRGIEQDKKNLSNIIEHLGYLKELHGVCILLKANDNRFNAIFMYCIKELLVHLHKSVTKNIVFCFTNSRTSLYTPGQSSVVLEKVLRDVGIEKELSLGRHNMFCLDNEAFIFLCSLKNTDIKYDEIIVSSFVESWKISSGETKKLFETVKGFPPHQLKETLSLVKARSRVLSLTKPIAEVSKTIQMNVATIQRKKKEIETSEMNLQELKKKLNCIEIHLESESLRYPRTVCTSPSCVEYLYFKDSDVKEIHYKTHCHVECYLENVTPKTTNNPALVNCAAMNNDGICNKCHCRWQNHMHLTYTQKRVEVPSENIFVKKNMAKEVEGIQKIENFVKDLQSIVEEYKKEQEIIIKASVKFGMFLRTNAITTYNDSVSEYLDYLIEEENKKPHKSETEKRVLTSLKETLDHYNAEVAVLQAVLKNDEENTVQITPEEIYELEQSLYDLKLSGKAIRESVELSRCGAESAHQYFEVPVNISPRKIKKSLLNKLLKPLPIFSAFY